MKSSFEKEMDQIRGAQVAAQTLLQRMDEYPAFTTDLSQALMVEFWRRVHADMPGPANAVLMVARDRFGYLPVSQQDKMSLQALANQPGKMQQWANLADRSFREGGSLRVVNWENVFDHAGIDAVKFSDLSSKLDGKPVAVLWAAALRVGGTPQSMSRDLVAYVKDVMSFVDGPREVPLTTTEFEAGARNLLDVRMGHFLSRRDGLEAARQELGDGLGGWRDVFKISAVEIDDVELVPKEHYRF